MYVYHPLKLEFKSNLSRVHVLSRNALKFTSFVSPRGNKLLFHVCGVCHVRHKITTLDVFFARDERRTSSRQARMFVVSPFSSLHRMCAIHIFHSNDLFLWNPSSRNNIRRQNIKALFHFGILEFGYCGSSFFHRGLRDLLKWKSSISRESRDSRAFPLPSDNFDRSGCIINFLAPESTRY